jgi:hypothetical protein
VCWCSLARTRDAATGRSLLVDSATSCLPKYMERSAYMATAWRLGRYYRTCRAYIEVEVNAVLNDPGSQFQRGPVTLTARGTATDHTPAFVATDTTTCPRAGPATPSCSPAGSATSCNPRPKPITPGPERI